MKEKFEKKCFKQKLFGFKGTYFGHIVFFLYVEAPKLYKGYFHFFLNYTIFFNNMINFSTHKSIKNYRKINNLRDVLYFLFFFIFYICTIYCIYIYILSTHIFLFKYLNNKSYILIIISSNLFNVYMFMSKE